MLRFFFSNLCHTHTHSLLNSKKRKAVGTPSDSDNDVPSKNTLIGLSADK